MLTELIFIFIFSAHIVNPQWLLDCCEKGELLPEIDYLSSIDRDEKYRSKTKSFLSNKIFHLDKIRFPIQPMIKRKIIIQIYRHHP